MDPREMDFSMAFFCKRAILLKCIVRKSPLITARTAISC